MDESNENIDLIMNDPKKALIKLSLPTTFSLILVLLYNLTDSIWVAGLGSDPLSAIGFITPLFLIIAGLGNGIGAGANSLVSRFIGSENQKQANNAALHGILLGVIISVIFTIIMFLFMKDILILMGAGSALGYGLEYGYILFGALFLFIFETVELSLFRSEGDMKRATFAGAISSVLNMILDPIFIYVLNFGMVGAAWATVISVAVSCIIMSYWFWVKKDLFLDLSLKNFSFDSKIILDELEVAIPSTLEISILAVLSIATNAMLVVAGGTDAVGVYTAAIRIVEFSSIPLYAIGMSVLTIAGVAYGASNYQNLKITHSYSIKLSLILSIILGVIIVVFSPYIAALFSYTDASASLAPRISTAVCIFSLYVIAVPMGLISSMLFQGVGKGTYSLICTLISSLVLEILFEYLCAFIFGLGEIGIYGGSVVGCFIGSVIAYIWASVFIRKFGESLKS